MTKNKCVSINGVNIYSINYLMNEELTESDLTDLCDTSSLLYSIIVGMYRHIKSKKTITHIIADITKDNKWLNKNTWTYKQREAYEDKLTKVFINLYAYTPNIARQNAQWYMVKYGFTTK